MKRVMHHGRRLASQWACPRHAPGCTRIKSLYIVTQSIQNDTCANHGYVTATAASGYHEKQTMKRRQDSPVSGPTSDQGAA